MRVACFTKVDDADAAKIYECSGFEHNSHGPYKHEVVLHHAKCVQGAAAPEEEKIKRHVMIEIDGGDRQAAGPLRFARVIITDTDPDVQGEAVALDKAIDGSAGITPNTSAVGYIGDKAPVVPPEVDEDALQADDANNSQSGTEQDADDANKQQP